MAAVYFIVAVILFIPFSPVIIFQALRLRKNIPSGPRFEGELKGVLEGKGEPLDILFIGDSTVAGYGVNELEETLAGAVAAGVNIYSNRKVRWQAFGRKGITTAGLAKLIEHIPADAKPDLIISVAGVNDALGLMLFSKTRESYVDFSRMLRDRFPEATIVLAGLPALERFPALYFPLSFFMGLWGRSIDAAINRVAKRSPQMLFLRTPVPKARHFCTDGVHPGKRGYALWGEYFGREVTTALRLRIPGA